METTTATIPLKTIVEAGNDLKELLELKFKAATGFKIFKATRQAIQELEAFESSRQKLFERLGKPDELNPGALQIPGESLEEFGKEINELLSQEVEIAVPIISMSEIEEGLLGEISPLALHRLNRLIY